MLALLTTSLQRQPGGKGPAVDGGLGARWEDQPSFTTTPNKARAAAVMLRFFMTDAERARDVLRFHASMLVTELFRFTNSGMVLGMGRQGHAGLACEESGGLLKQQNHCWRRS